MAKVDLSQFHQTFFDESIEGLDGMEAALLQLDSGATDPELVNIIFRAAHSIKGGSATFGFQDIAAFTHVAEELLDELRSHKRAISGEIVEVLLRCVDVLRSMLECARAGQPAADATSDAVLRELKAFLTAAPTDRVSAPDSVPPVAAVAPRERVPQVSGDWQIYFSPRPSLLVCGNDPLRMIRELSGLGKLSVHVDSSALPDLDALNPEVCHLRWTLGLPGSVGEAHIRAVFDWAEGDCDLSIERIAAEPAMPEPEKVASAVSPPEPEKAATAVSTPGPESTATTIPTPVGAEKAVPLRVENAPANAEASSIRVSIDKVDALINTVGELVITQSMLGELGEHFDMSKLDALRAGLAQLERNTRELQENVMRIRMLPISVVFQRFPRLVRDTARKLGKQVHLELHGEQTELDKTVLEKIGDPLVHLVRNAIDHGLETPERRIASGKPATGTLRLDAYHQGGNIVVEVSDDGAGLNRDAIVRKAIERGLIRSVQGETLSDDEVAELIFQPGFSTAAATTDLSGRGVGMDVVRSNVNELGGSVLVRSQPGRGSVFTITLPLTLAIIDGLTASVGGESYIVPLVAVVESLQLRPEQINRIVGRSEVFRFRDEVLPIIPLHAVFGCKDAITDPCAGIVIVVEGDGTRAGLLVDTLLGQQQAVIKSLESNYEKVPGLAGATILGDGSIALIVDVAGLVRYAHRRRAA